MVRELQLARQQLQGGGLRRERSSLGTQPGEEYAEHEFLSAPNCREGWADYLLQSRRGRLRGVTQCVS